MEGWRLLYSDSGLEVSRNMPRTCFVIMPFSQTSSCSEEEWTDIFDNVFKPAVEGAGLDYECRRSSATRGNLIKDIILDLNDSHVVIADLTDRNANVFYELGVRHALRNRTILLAQKRGDIPFDLKVYALHVYSWKTKRGKDALAVKLKELLNEIDTNPDRADNPVSDFLGSSSQTGGATSVDQSPSVHALVGNGGDGRDFEGLARRLAAESRPQAAQAVYRMTQQELRPRMVALLEDLNSRDIPRVSREEVPEAARKFFAPIEILAVPVELFCLAAVEERWLPGVSTGIRFASDWITLSERLPRHSIKFAQGAPALLAWRLLILMGAKALKEMAFDLISTILGEPIEVEQFGGGFSSRPFPQRRDLFWPEAFLTDAKAGMDYVKDIWSTQPHVQKFFDVEEDYHFWIAQFLMIVAIVNAKDDGENFWPGYRIFPQASRAMDSLTNRLASHSGYRQLLAGALGVDDSSLNRIWPEVSARANSADLGSGYSGRDRVSFPNQLERNG